jgi:uncharacterized protein
MSEKFDRSQLVLVECDEAPQNVLGYGRPPGPALNQREEVVDGLRILRDVAVEMRDGAKIYADIYMAEGAGFEPVLGTIVGWAAFGKHNTSDHLPPSTGLPNGTISRHTAFEVVDPAFWCPKGYAVVYPDPRGSWNSEGVYQQYGQELEDAYDLCEWLGVQPWSNGKVAFTGVSYPGTISWGVATLNPPHLAAIMPWEGFTDMYREFAYHGGIRETGHTYLVGKVMKWEGRTSEDIQVNYDSHPFDDEYWDYKRPDLSKITVPVYVCGSWTDQGLHCRGTFEGFRKVSSSQKWLQAHGRQKWAEYYKPENVARQLMFFDHFLLGKDSGIESRPPVEIEVRDKGFVGETRAEQEWPLARTKHTPLYIDAATGTANLAAPADPAQVVYEPSAGGKAVFEHVFDEDTELTGYMNLTLFVEVQGSSDMDLFVGLQKFDAAGEYVGFPYFAFHVDGPVALGWLRVSHRELAPDATPEQPTHLHKREQLLSPGEIVEANVEIWPSSTLFRKGEKLRIIVQGQDIYTYEHAHEYGSHLELRNAGKHVIHTGGKYASNLLLPVIPR